MNVEQCEAILVAAGQGERLANYTNGTPKQFVPLNATPLFIWSLTTLASHQSIKCVHVAVPSDWQGKVRAIIAQFLPQFSSKIFVVAGGKSRQESVLLALELISKKDEPPANILVHDAVRPFLTSEAINKVLAQLQTDDAVTLGISLSDSIKKVDRQKIVLDDLDRSQFMLIQTPQAARLSLLLKAHHQAKIKNEQNTDDASLIRALGTQVKVVTGDRLNFKITEPEDLSLALALINHYQLSPTNLKFGTIQQDSAKQNI